MTKTAFSLGITLVLYLLTGCAELEKINAQIEAEQKEDAQRRAERKRKIEKDIHEKRRAEKKHDDDVKKIRDGESADAWYRRAAKFYQHRTHNRNGYSKKMQRFNEIFIAELKRIAQRNPEEDFDKYEARVKNLLPEYHTDSDIPEYIFVKAKKVVEEEFYAEKKRKRKQNAVDLLLQTEKELTDPAFKYPYSDRIAGIELYDGYLSGLSSKWIATSNFLPYIKTVAGGNSVYNGDIAADLAKAKQTVREVILHKNVAFYFDKRYGILHSVSFDVNGDPESVTKKIEEYKGKYPGLKHIRKTQRDGKNFNKFPVSYKCVWDIRTDTLESKRMKIVIESQSLIGLENFVILSNQLSDLQKKDLKEMHKKTIRDGLEKNAVITITDKVLKEYFSSLKSTPAAK